MPSGTIPLCRNFTDANGRTKPVLLSRGTTNGGARIGDERIGPARPGRLRVMRDRDGANGALNGTVQFWGVYLGNPDMESAVPPTKAVLKGDGVAVNYDTAIPHVAFANYNWVVLVFRNDLLAKTGTATVAAGGTAVVGAGTAFTTELFIGATISINGEVKHVMDIADDTHLTVASAYAAAVAGAAITGSVDPVMRVTDDFTEANNGGNARITFAAAGRAPAGSRVEVHFVKPLQIMADGAHPFEESTIKVPTVMWLQSTGATISATSAYLEAVSSSG